MIKPFRKDAKGHIHGKMPPVHGRPSLQEESVVVDEKLQESKLDDLLECGWS